MITEAENIRYAYKGLLLAIRILASDYTVQKSIYPAKSDFGVEMIWGFRHHFETLKSNNYSLVVDLSTFSIIEKLYDYVNEIEYCSDDTFFNFESIEKSEKWESIRSAAKSTIPFLDNSVGRLDDEETKRLYIG